MPYFKPYEIFQQDTTNAVMEAMLVADVTQKDSPVSSIALVAGNITGIDMLMRLVDANLSLC